MKMIKLVILSLTYTNLITGIYMHVDPPKPIFEKYVNIPEDKRLEVTQNEVGKYLYERSCWEFLSSKQDPQNEKDPICSNSGLGFNEKDDLCTAVVKNLSSEKGTSPENFFQRTYQNYNYACDSINVGSTTTYLKRKVSSTVPNVITCKYVDRTYGFTHLKFHIGQSFNKEDELLVYRMDDMTGIIMVGGIITNVDFVQLKARNGH